MFTRHVILELKPNTATEFTDVVESNILPILRKQKGFQDEITFVAAASPEAFAVSLWDSKENAEAYNRGSYADVTKILSKLVEGTPRVEVYEVANSTFHKIAATAKAA